MASYISFNDGSSTKTTAQMGLSLVSVDHGAYSPNYVEKTVPYRTGSYVFRQGTYSDRTITFSFATKEYDSLANRERDLETLIAWFAKASKIYDSTVGRYWENCRLDGAPSIDRMGTPKAVITVSYKCDPVAVSS